MRRILVLVLLLCLTLLTPIVAPSRPAAAQADVPPTGLLVQIHAPPGDESSLRTALDRLAQAQGMDVVRVWPRLRAGLLQPRQTAVGAAARQQILESQRLALLADPAVAHAEVDAPVYAADLLGEADNVFGQMVTDPPNDPGFPEQYALARIAALDGWAISQGSPDVAVAVIDSGYDLAHEDILPDSLWINPAEAAGVAGVDDDLNGYVDDLNGWDWVEDDGIANDPYGHGTHVGGVIAAATNNGVGVASVGRNLRVLPLRILDQYGRGAVSDLLDALIYAVDQGIRIVNLSLVTTSDSTTLHGAIQSLENEGILIVAAAGNGSTSVSNYYPAAWPEVFTVSATDDADGVALFSNYGEAIDIGAPGSAVLSTYKNNSYYANSGTSMATPHVSALAGLILSLRPDFTLAQLTDLIRASADDVNQINYPGRDNYVGEGRINVGAALWTASQGLMLAAGADNLLPAGEVGTLSVSVGAGRGPLPVQGAVVGYTLHNQASGEIIQTGASLTGPAATASIRVTAPVTAGLVTLDLVAGQVTASLPVYVFPAPLQVTLATENELSAQDTSLTFHLGIRDGNGDPLPVSAQVRLSASMGRFSNNAQEIEVQVGEGGYVGVLRDWSILDLLDHDLVIHAQVLATGQTASIQVPVKTYRSYLPWVFNP